MTSSSVAICAIVNPEPAVVTVVTSWVPAPIAKSPEAAGVMFPDVGALLLPVVPADVSRGLARLIPENSAITKDISPFDVPAVVNVTVSTALEKFLAD